ncbi:hypothetical protein BVU76_20570 [Mycolicibacterium porcinum]|nr:hypothetical protein BVU76_20570 [Mycolicibacterium porcinum]
MALRIDEDGPRANVPQERPAAVLSASPDTVVGLAAGAITVDAALADGDFHGDVQILRSAFPPDRAGVR